MEHDELGQRVHNFILDIMENYNDKTENPGFVIGQIIAAIDVIADNINPADINDINDYLKANGR